MIASITGIGWVTSESMGCGRRHEVLIEEGSKLPKLTSSIIFGKKLLHFGRLDAYSKLGIAAVAFALRDAHLYEWKTRRQIGIIASTVYGCLETDMNYLETMIPHEGSFASPNLFACTLPNVFLGEATIQFGLTGPCFVVNESELSGIMALRMALNSVSLEECSVMIAGFCDTGRPESFRHPAEVTPGALFFVIGKTPADEALSYGELDMDNEGKIFFQGREIQDLQTLLKQCLGT